MNGSRATRVGSGRIIEKVTSLRARSFPTSNDAIQPRAGSGRINRNQSFGQNPFVTIPQDVDQNPFRLVCDDVKAVFGFSRLLPLICYPFTPFISGPLDELYPSWSNMYALALHMVLLTTQLLMLFTLPIMAIIFWFLPGLVNLAYFVAFVAITYVFMRLLNGPPTTEALVGLPAGLNPVNDEHELWFFINGVAIGFVVKVHFPNTY